MEIVLFECCAVIICALGYFILSQNSVNKEGYVQKEISFALRNVSMI